MKKTTALQAILLLLQLLCFGVSSQSDSLTATMDGEERQFLYSAIQGFVGKWWNGSNLYPEPCGWTPIQGVFCDLFDNGMWYVTSIKIGPIFDNSLKCSKNAAFSSNLFRLKNLKRLSLVDCFHQPTNFPSMQWSELSSTLKTLEFRSNKGLVGDIPSVLGQILSLQSLVLTENSLTGEIPWELGNLVSLKRLSLSSNQLSGPLPISLGANLSGLLIMDISSNSLSGPLPSSLGRLSSLLKLDLSNNFFSGDLPPELCNLKNLTLLDLGNNGFTGGLQPCLQVMIFLQDMVFSDNPLGGGMKELDWKKLEKLVHLDLSNTTLVGEIPDSITELKKLRFLALDNNRLCGSVSPKLATMPSLSSLYLHGNNLSGELEFSVGFYKRMGRRFASWRNPNLCYRFPAVNSAGEEGPAGVEKCINGEDCSQTENSTTSLEISKGSDYMSPGFLWALLVEQGVILSVFSSL
ncbi:Piriformospora indica-insensitive protein 2 [Platanthera zijinensis]|uniref:Piriformospora indica-insensitive protein 2 n=1 Tax=Platanthera zijinensis TaxID=2320716 RepID=A0AAP0BT07_9ASPA